MESNQSSPAPQHRVVGRALGGYYMLKYSNDLYIMLWLWGGWITLRRRQIGILGPYDPVLFSERNGMRNPIIKAFGFRLFIESRIASNPSDQRAGDKETT